MTFLQWLLLPPHVSPVDVFDGEGGQLISTLLRPGNALPVAGVADKRGAGRAVAGLLRRCDPADQATLSVSTDLRARIVLSSLGGFPADLFFRAYCERGQCENRGKDLKNALQAD